MSGAATATPPTAGSSPRPGAAPGRRRRALFWIGLAVLLAVGAAAIAGISGALERDETGALSPDSAGPDGLRALASIVEDRGVEIRRVTDHVEAERMLREAPATLVLADTPFLSDEAVDALVAAAADTVLVEPTARVLGRYFDSASAGIAPGDAVAPACDVPEAVRAGAIAPRALFTAPADGAAACYPDGDGSPALLRAPADGGVVSAIGARGVLTNDALGAEGHAALGIGLVGKHPLVVWYTGGPDDTDLAGAVPSIGELTPAWVTPAIAIAILAALTAAVWRGRRFGPLVIEPLPVTVRASETMQGRARLYASTRDHAHAAALLRAGARRRLAARLGLADDEAAGAGGRPGIALADAVAALLGADRAAVRAALVEREPRTDAELLAVSDDLRDLERAVAAALGQDQTPASPGGTTNGRTDDE